NYNELQGSIPTQLSTLGQLADVNFGNNHLIGTISDNLRLFQSQFDHNCLSGTPLPNQQNCLETREQYIGKVAGGLVGCLVVVGAFAFYVYRVYTRVKEAQRSSDTIEYGGSMEKLTEDGDGEPKKQKSNRVPWDSTPAPY
ncbi:UNVERIFIED_CONTAM: hypothetical protein HDU68_010322, partial [Siphonaria sp. JEL0065]